MRRSNKPPETVETRLQTVEARLRRMSAVSWPGPGTTSPRIAMRLSINIDVVAMQQYLNPAQIQAVMSGIAQVIAAQK